MPYFKFGVTIKTQTLLSIISACDNRLIGETFWVAIVFVD